MEESYILIGKHRTFCQSIMGSVCLGQGLLVVTKSLGAIAFLARFVLVCLVMSFLNLSKVS